MPACKSQFPALIRLTVVASVVLAIGACSKPAAQGDGGAAAASQARSTGAPSSCDAGNGGITLPDGYCASVFADNLGHARHLTVAPNGDIYVNTWFTERHKTDPPAGGYIVALRDADKDGRAEMVERFGTTFVKGAYGGGTGIATHRGALYVEADNQIVRYRLAGGALVPGAAAEVVLGGLPKVGDHQAHPFVITDDETMYVNSGSMTNACQLKNRALESPGQKPCAELAQHAGIWRYRANDLNQTFSDRERFATGLRNTLAFDVEPGGDLYAVVHGRDQLSENWPKKFTAAQNTDLPAEVLVQVAQGKDYGWPMCYFDEAQSAYFLAPEYGGDGRSSRGCETKERPLQSFPAHWAPMAMVFTGADGPFADYRNGAFVSFHGSWNREPAQSGFLIAFVPFAEGRPSGKYQEFATGFAGPAMPAAPDQAVYRPVGIAFGVDGALYVSDDVKGRIWRIVRTTK